MEEDATRQFVTAAEKNSWNGHLENKNNPHGITKAQLGLENVDNTKDVDKPVSTKQQAALDNKLDKTGDVQNNVVAFVSGDSLTPTGWADVGFLASNETIASLMRKISLTVKNVRYLYKMLGTTDISTLGGGTVTGAINQLNSKLGRTKIKDSFRYMHFYKCGESITLDDGIAYNKTAAYGICSTPEYITSESGELYIGYVEESFPTEEMIPFVIPCLLSTDDFSVTQTASIYIKSNGGVYLSVPSTLKSTIFNNIIVNGVYFGYYGR